MTFPKEDLKQEFQNFLASEESTEVSSSQKMLTSLVIYKALRAGWSPNKAVQSHDARQVTNDNAMYHLWRRAKKVPASAPIDESIVPVQERRHRISYARNVPNFFKKLFNHEKNTIQITNGPFFRSFKRL